MGLSGEMCDILELVGVKNIRTSEGMESARGRLTHTRQLL